MAADGRDRPPPRAIGAVEGNFDELTLAVGERRRFGGFVLVEWSNDYGDGAICRNVTIARSKTARPCG